MTPEGVAAVKRRIKVMLSERAGTLARAASGKLSDFAARGALHSSMYVIAVHGVCSEELDARGQLAWAIIRSVVDNEGWSPSENHLQQVETEIREVLAAG